MAPAFLPTAPVLPAAASRARPVCAQRPHQLPTMALRSSPASLKYSTKISFDDDDAGSPPPVHSPEVTAISAAVCEFMNQEHVRDIANYIVKFGRKFDDLSQLSAVKMTALDAAGFTADVISCDDSSHCVCVQERLEWPLGLCMSPSDVISALKHLSMACGLPADF